MFRHSYCNLLDMKSFISLLFFSLTIVSCSSVKVITDFDSSVNFSKYASFAFSKSQIKKLEISDLALLKILCKIKDMSVLAILI